MPLIPFPNIPSFPGVPSIPRISPGTPAISISIASPQSTPASQAVPYADTWGIYDSVSGDPLYKTIDGGTLSFFSLSYVRRMQISDFPIEANDSSQGAAFASFNKVWQPANPIVTFALSGSETEQYAFLSALDAACTSTALYNVVTPETYYEEYSIESYSYQRTAHRGATMLKVEISLKQILQVSPSYTQTAIASPINSPQSPSAAPAVNSGLTQPSAPPQSALSNLLHPLGVN
jgi:Dit-like phage tail protein